MVCSKPLHAFSRGLTVSGKKQIVFCPKRAEVFALRPDFYEKWYRDDGITLMIPCGQCVLCRLERSRQWAVRCMHEASLYDNNCFVTLTYSDEFLPKDGSLDLSHFQLFMKRLRKRFGQGIRFFHCGEYGDTYGRPHYHVCLFNFDLPDKELWKIENGNRLYTSEILEGIWGMGFCPIGSVTFDSAAYVARYIMKKITGDKAESHYCGRKPEYTTMSRRPGLASEWFKKFKTEVYVTDSVVVKGVEVQPPKFYDRMFEFDEPEQFALVRQARIDRAKAKPLESSFKRLAVKGKVTELKIKALTRKLEQEI